MWHARISRRDFIEICLGASKPLEGNLQTASGVVVDDDASTLHAYWDREPTAGYWLPNLVVVPNGDTNELLTAINASPQAPAPISAMCRILTRDEARAYFTSAPLESTDDALPITVALAMVEAVLHSEGRIGLRQLSPAVCKRTLSYAWGKALAARVPAKAIEVLPSRWLEAYGLINPQSSTHSVRRTVEASVGVLGVCAQLGLGVQPGGAPGSLAYALLRGDRVLQETAWRKLAQVLDNQVSLAVMAAATREERGMYLQQALRAASSGGASDHVAAACAFLATQVAPGSLEHFEVLRSAGSSAVIFWYALYAALQSPNEILATQSGLGVRLLRDIARVEEHLSRPVADLAYAELKALERLGVESVARKFGHAGEVEVELVPLVTSSFTYHSKGSRSRAEPYGQQLPMETDGYGVQRSESTTKARMAQILSALTQLVQELPDAVDDPAPSGQRKVRKK